MLQLKYNEIAEVRNTLLDSQGGVCAICKREPVRPCLDHSHTKKLKGTGQVRGVLCSSCNVLLAKLENNAVRYGIGLSDLPAVARNIADYLEKEHAPMLHPSEAEKPKKLKKASYKKLVSICTKKGIKYPEYPKSGTLTIPLAKLYEKVELVPEFYA